MKSSAFKRLVRLGRDPFVLLIVVLAGLGTTHILVRIPIFGEVLMEITSISGATHFLAGEGWTDIWGKPLVTWPPLFSLLLVAFGWVGIEPLTAGRFINASTFGLTIFAAGCWLRTNLRSRPLGLVATATLAVSLPLSRLAASFMTDPLFVLFTLLALIQLAAFLQRGKRTPLWWAAVCTALAAVTRYPGVALIGSGVLLLLLRRTPPLAARLKDAIVFGVVSSLPLAGVLTRNWAVSGTLTGDRYYATGQSLSAGLHQIGEVFREWVVPPHAPDGVAYLLWLAVTAVGLAGVAVVLRSRQPNPEVAPTYFRLGPALPFAVYALGYCVFMVAVVPFTAGQGIDSRYLLSVHVPLLLTAVFLLDQFLSIEMAGRRAAIRYGLVSLVLLAALAHGGFSAHQHLRITAKAWRGAGKSSMSDRFYWQPSETLKYLRTNRMEGRIFSNDPHRTWLWDRYRRPKKHQHLATKLHRVIPRIMRETAGDGAHIVWLLGERSWYAYDDIDLRCLPGVEPVAELADGTVLRVTAAEPFDAGRHRACKQRYLKQLIQQAGEPVVRASWDVYRTGRKLIYAKQPCTPADVQAKFVLHVFPADPEDLPAHRQRYSSDNLDFYFDFNQRGVRRGDQCMVLVYLPAYPIDRVYIGQWISAEDRTVWDAEFAGAGN